MFSYLFVFSQERCQVHLRLFQSLCTDIGISRVAENKNSPSTPTTILGPVTIVVTSTYYSVRIVSCVRFDIYVR